MQYSVFALAFAMVATSSSALGRSLEVHLTCEVREFGSERPTRANAVRVTITPPPTNAVLRRNLYVLTAAIDPGDEIQSVSIEIDPESPFLPREFKLRRLPRDEQDFKRHLRIYVVDDEEPTTYPHLQTARSMLDEGRVEKPYALFERAYRALESDVRTTQYGVFVRYNYARALLSLCTQSGYDTCSNAASVCERLATDYAEESAVFEEERITLQVLRDCEHLGKAVSTEELKERHQLFVASLRNRTTSAHSALASGGADYLEAGEILDQLIDEYDAHSKVWIEDLRVPKHSLERDAGVAYARYANHLRRVGEPPEAQLSAATLAIERFESAQRDGDTSDLTAKDLDWIADKYNRASSEVAAREGIEDSVTGRQQ